MPGGVDIGRSILAKPFDIRELGADNVAELRVGLEDALAKTVAYRLLEPIAATRQVATNTEPLGIPASARMLGLMKTM